MLIARTRMQQLKQSQQLQQQSSQRVGALSLIPQWVPARTPTVHWGPISGKAVGGPNTVQNRRSQCEKHTKNGSGGMSIQGARALATRALSTRVCCVMADPETKKSMRRSTRTPMRKSGSVNGGWLGRVCTLHLHAPYILTAPAHLLFALFDSLMIHNGVPRSSWSRMEIWSGCSSY